MLVGRVQGPAPTRSTGDLPFTVTVADVHLRVPNDVGAAVRQVVNCDVVTRPPGHLEP